MGYSEVSLLMGQRDGLRRGLAPGPPPLPVQFVYKAQPDGPRHFGFIAEEVNEVMPELVIRDATGQPETVAYHELPAMLLNELQKQQAQIAAQKAEIDTLKATLAKFDGLAARLVALEAWRAAK